MAHSFDIAQKAEEHPSIMEFCDSHTQSLRPDEQKRMLRGSIAAACRQGLQEDHQHPEEKRARVTMVPVKMHVKTDLYFLGIFCAFITIWFALQWRGGRKHSFLCEDRFSSLC